MHLMTFFGPKITALIKQESSHDLKNWLSPLFDFLKTPFTRPLFLDQFQSWLLIGTGGSTLGAQALAALNPKAQIDFLDSVDPWTVQQKFNATNPKTMGYLVISKSGQTVETLRQFLECDPSRVVIVSQDQSLASKGAFFIEHPKDIGGRFSIFSKIGHLHASLLGLDWNLFCEGAKQALVNAKTEEFLESVGVLANLLNCGITEHVLWIYGDRLDAFGHWWIQLWAESLGKKINDQRFGTTPILAHGPRDQHSLLQLYLDGPKNKFFTMLSYSQDDECPLPNTLHDHPLLEKLSTLSFSKLMQIEFESTKETLEHHGCPGRTIIMKTFNEYHLGYLMAKSMIEVIMIAYFLDISPFDQPAVEDIKKRILKKIVSKQLH